MPRCFENGNGDFGPEGFGPYTAHNYAQMVKRFHGSSVSYSRVLGQRPTFYCPLLAVSCPEVWARMYRHIYTVQSLNQCTMFIRKNKIRIIILQPVDGATRRVICPASNLLKLAIMINSLVPKTMMH